MTEQKFDPTGPVVVGVDGSTSSEAALRWAANIATSSTRELLVVLVLSHPEPQYVVPAEPVWPWPMARRTRPDELQHSVALLNSLVEAMLGDDRPFEAVVRTGDPAGELLNTTVERDASLLVLGRRGMGGFKSLLLGSVSDQCAGHARCPVAVIPHDVSEAHGPIIVGTDGSDESVIAALWAADYATRIEVPLRLVMCWDVGPGPYPYEPLLNDGRSPAQVAIAGVEAKIRAHTPGLTIESSVLIGAPGKLLPELAAQTRAQLLVVGSRGHGGLGSLLLGSVAHRTLHRATSAVVVVRP